MDWYLAVMRNYLVFTGRARRKEFWMFALFYFVFSLLLGIATSIVGDRAAKVLMGLFGLVHLLPAIGVTIRRLHDADRTGWWILVSFVPVVGGLILIVLCVLEGTRGSNRYGADPQGGEPVMA